MQELHPQGRLDGRAGWLQLGAKSLRQVLEQSGQTRSRCQPPVAPRSSWGSAAGLPSLACLCLAFMAAAASGPRHPPLRHLHRRERESPTWGRWMVCWFTSTRGRTSQTRMESILSATGLRGFRGEAWASRLKRSRAIRGVAVLCADRLYLSLIPAIIVAVVFHPVALFPCTFVALVSIATILPPAITVTPSSNKTVTGRTRRKAAGMPTRAEGMLQGL